MPMMPMEPAKAVRTVRPFFRPQVVEAEGQGGAKGHLGLAQVAVLQRLFRGGGRIGVRVVDDLPVPQLDDAGGIPLGQLWVVGDHHHQPVLGHPFQKLHDLDAGLAVQGAGGLISEEDVRVVDQGPGNGHPLHLPAGHLAGALMELVSQPHLLQGLFCPLPPFPPGDAADGQRQFHVGQHRLVGDQVVALVYLPWA